MFSLTKFYKILTVACLPHDILEGCENFKEIQLNLFKLWIVEISCFWGVLGNMGNEIR